MNLILLKLWIIKDTLCIFLIFALSLPAKPIDEKYRDKKTNPIRVLLVGQMRSGSSFAGEIFHQHPDSFYMYEPLLALAKSNASSTEDIVRAIQGHAFESNTAVDVIRNILDCKLSEVPKSILKSDFLRHSDTGYEFLSCTRRSHSKETWNICLNAMTETCKKSKLRIVKTIRMTAKMADTLLDQMPDLKLIYLVRDPRAVIHSRITLNSFLQGHVEKESYDLCNRLETDMAYLETSKNKERIQKVQYENLAKDPKSVAKAIYSRIGLNVPPEVLKWIDNNTQSPGSVNPYSTIRHSASNIYKWLEKMDKDTIRKIDTECSYVYEQLGYEDYYELLQRK